jgi:Na+/melibiose symporter-like transporter
MRGRAINVVLVVLVVLLALLAVFEAYAGDWGFAAAAAVGSALVCVLTIRGVFRRARTPRETQERVRRRVRGPRHHPPPAAMKKHNHKGRARPPDVPKKRRPLRNTRPRPRRPADRRPPGL